MIKKVIVMICLIVASGAAIAETTIDVQKDRRSQMTIDLGQVVVEAVARIERTRESSILAPDKKPLSADNREILKRHAIKMKLRKAGFYPREWVALYTIADDSVYDDQVAKVNYRKAVYSAGKWGSVAEMLTECQTITGKGYADMVFLKRDIESTASHPIGGLSYIGWTDVLIDSGYQAFRKTLKNHTSAGITRKGWKKVKKMVQCWGGTATAARRVGNKLANQRFSSRQASVDTAVKELRNLDVSGLQKKADLLVDKVKKCRLPPADEKKYQITCGALHIDFDSRSATFGGGVLLSSEGNIGTKYTAEISGGESRKSTFSE